MKVDSILDTVHQILARDVAHGFQLAKLIGIQIPTAYDVGLRYRGVAREREGARVCFTLRAADTSLEVTVLLPYLNGIVSLPRVDALWKIAIDQLHGCAISLSSEWIKKHPESHKGTIADVIWELNKRLHDPATQEDWNQRAKTAAQELRYTAR